MRKIPIALILAAVFTAAVAIYVVFTVNTQSPPVWNTAANGSIALVTPQTYFVYGSEFASVVDGKSTSTTVSALGSHQIGIAVNDTSKIPWFIISGTTWCDSQNNCYKVGYILAMAYNETQLYQRYGNVIPISSAYGGWLYVNPSSAPGKIAIVAKGNIYPNAVTGTIVGAYLYFEYKYIGKVVMPNGFTWYLYLLNPLAGASASFKTNTISTYDPYGYVTGMGTSNYNPTLTLYLSSGDYVTIVAKTATNATASTTVTNYGSDSASTIYGPDNMVIGVVEPALTIAFPVKNGPVKITINP